MDSKHHLRERIHDFVMMPRHLKWMLIVAVCLAALGSLGLLLLSYPASWNVGYKAVDGKMRVTSALDFHFTRPMSRDVEITFSPAITGNWQFEDRLSNLHLSRTFRFEPIETWEPETTYTVTFHNLRNVFAFSGEDMAYTFTTQAYPQITSTVPLGGEVVSPDQQVILSLDSPNDGIKKYTIISEPQVAFSQIMSDDQKQISFVPQEPLLQGETYIMTIITNTLRRYRDTNEVFYEGPDAEAGKFTFTTQAPPGIASYAPQGQAVLTDAKIQVAFSTTPVAEELAKITIAPPIEGVWALEGAVATFTPTSALPFETDYLVTIPQGLRMQNNGYIEAAATHAFRTIGHVKVVTTTPQAQASGVAVDRQIKITFDQAVDHASAQKAISITPEVAMGFAWDENTLIVTPTNLLSLDMRYTVTVAAGIASVSGLAGDVDYSFSFSTEPSVIKLSVAYDHQDHKLSCEFAALKMALVAKGVRVGESELISLVGFDPTPKKGNVWGDPHVAFVGDIDGRQVSSGYGVYWDPIAKAGAKYRETEAFTSGSIQLLTEEISKGNPIVVWGNAASGKRVDWVTPSGKKIIAIIGEHTRVVKGFIGSKANPTRIIVTDPLYGDITYTAAAFDANWALLGRSGVIVR